MNTKLSTHILLNSKMTSLLPAHDPHDPHDARPPDRRFRSRLLLHSVCPKPNLSSNPRPFLWLFALISPRMLLVLFSLVEVNPEICYFRLLQL